MLSEFIVSYLDILALPEDQLEQIGDKNEYLD